MKRRKFLAAIFLCLISFCPAVLSAGQMFYFDEPVFNITVPGGFVALTRDISPSDEALGILGINYDELIKSLINKRVYLSATRIEPFAEINVALWRDDFSTNAVNLNNLTENELDLRAREYIGRSGGDAGFRLTGYSLYRTANEVYMVFDIGGGADGEIISGRQYQTVYDGVCVTFTIITDSEILSGDDADILKDMVDGCFFGEEKKGSAFANIMLVAGMFVIGAATMLAARRRTKKLEAERNEKRKQRRLSKPRPAYCPNCGAKMETGNTVCNACNKEGLQD